MADMPLKIHLPLPPHVFAGYDMATIVEAFGNVSPIEVAINEWFTRDPPKHDAPLTLALTYSLGGLTVENMAKLDNSSILMMLVLTKQLRSLPLEDRSWNTVTSCFASCSFAETMDDHGRFVANEYRQGNSGKYKADASALAELDEWYTNLVGSDVREATLKNGALQKIANWMESKVASVGKETKKTAYLEQPMLDVVVVQYPDPEHRYFHLYHIKLKVVVRSRRRWWFRVSSQVGLLGEFHTARYQPCEEAFLRAPSSAATGEERETLIQKGVRLLEQPST